MPDDSSLNWTCSVWWQTFMCFVCL